VEAANNKMKIERKLVQRVNMRVERSI